MTDPIFLDWYMKGPTFYDIPVYAHIFHSEIFEAACSLGIQWIDCNICLTTSNKGVKKQQQTNKQKKKKKKNTIFAHACLFEYVE